MTDTAGAFEALVLSIWLAVTALWNFYRPGPYGRRDSNRVTLTIGKPPTRQNGSIA